MRPSPLGLCLLVALLVSTGALVAPRAGAAGCAFEPNVVFLVDTSGSMAHIVWHPAFDPAAPTACNDFTQTLQLLDDRIETHCGTTRTYRVDPALQARGIRTRFDPGYLNWLHGPESQPYLFEIEAPDSGTLPSCLGGGSYAAYQESRLTAAQRFLRDVACRVTAQADPRLGLARPRVGADPAGGYLSLPVDDDTPAHAAAFDAAVDDLEPIGWGPLGETLFHTHTYFMSRDPAALPLGVDGFTAFPAYAADTTGGLTVSPPPSPVEAACQEHIVVILADDAPTRDDFDADGPEAAGFDDFALLVGNYNPDDVFPEAGDEEPGTSPTCTSGCEVALYLDDVAQFMRQENFRPDLRGVQGLRVHTVAFGRDAFGLALLAKTADAGGGLFLLPEDADLLAGEILAAGAPRAAPVPALAGPGHLTLALLLAAAGALGLAHRPRRVRSGASG